MPAAQDGPLGACAYCEREFTGAGIALHLRGCAVRRAAIAKADRGRRKRLRHYHVRVQSPYTGHFLHLEQRGDTSLIDLDDYLRGIWLECCGHLSGFRIGREFYTQMFDDDEMMPNERSMAVDVAEIFKPNLTMRHEYDFGTTTELDLKVMAVREGRPLSADPITLLARNEHRPPPCAVCGEGATAICVYCNIEAGDPERAYCCEAHRSAHAEHDDYGDPVAVYNSPRSGVCGYDGPAVPPY